MASDSDEISDMASDSDETPEIRYDRDEAVAAVRGLIDFATKMYMDETAYEFPPSTGWPSITPDSMRLFGKTDVVVDLLRHLPYLSKDYGWDPERRPQLMPALSFQPFQLYKLEDSQNAERLRAATEGHGIYEHAPAHVVGLAARRPNDHGVLLDTKLGVVFWDDAAEEFKTLSPFPTLEFDNDEDDEMSSGEKEWRENHMVWAIPDFFATLKHHLKELHFVPMSPRRVVDGFHGPDSHSQQAVDRVKGIYHAHGWPDLERYRKQDCLKAIHTALCEDFPDELEDREWIELQDSADAQKATNEGG